MASRQIVRVGNACRATCMKALPPCSSAQPLRHSRATLDLSRAKGSALRFTHDLSTLPTIIPELIDRPGASPTPQMAGKSPRNRLQKLFHRNQDSETEDATSPPHSPTTPGRQQRTRSRSASLRETIANKVPARASSKARSGRTSTDQTTPYGTHTAAITSLDDAPPLPKVSLQSGLSSDLGRLTIHQTQNDRSQTEVPDDRTVQAAPPRRPRRSDEFPVDNELPANNQSSVAPSLSRKPLASAFQSGDTPQAPTEVTNVSSIRQVLPLDDHQLSRKPDVGDLRKQSVPRAPRDTALPDESRGVDSDLQTRNFSRPSVDKPLPIAPDEFDPDLIARYNRQEEETKVESALGVERGYLVKDSPIPVDLTGVVDLGTSENTTVHERWAPAVTHETIVENVHEIREEVITREIHTHHYYHRVLPIIDIEVLPARHFVPMEGGYAEIAEEEVPGRAGKNAQWMIAEMVSKMLPKGQTSNFPRQFTARQFHGTEGDYKEYVTPEGVKRTETTWVYPPELETGGQLSGQTYPFHFDTRTPQQQGIQARLPGGNVIGISPLLAQQRRQQAEAQQLSQSAEILSSGLAQYQHLPCTQDENRLLQFQAVPAEGELNAVIHIGKWLEDEESSISHEVQLTREGGVDVPEAVSYSASSCYTYGVSKHSQHIVGLT
nr:hypothetical protein CFP56_12009 [Quercus suber]